MSKQKKSPRFVLQLAQLQDVPKGEAMQATIFENMRGELVYRIGSSGENETRAVENLAKRITHSAYGAEYIYKMGKVCKKWTAKWMRDFEKGIVKDFGADALSQLDDAINETVKACFKTDVDTDDKTANTQSQNKPYPRTVTDETIALTKNVWEFETDRYRITVNHDDKHVEVIQKVVWHTITIADKQIQRGIVPTPWGEVRVSLGENGEPGGSFEGKECAAFSFWFEGWEYYRETAPQTNSQAERCAVADAQYCQKYKDAFPSMVKR